MIPFQNTTPTKTRNRYQMTKSFPKKIIYILRTKGTITLDLWGSDYLRVSSTLLLMQETWVRSLGWEDSPGEGNGNPLQYSSLENSIDRGAWQTTVHGVERAWHDLGSKQQQQLKRQGADEQQRRGRSQALLTSNPVPNYCPPTILMMPIHTAII